MPSDLPGGWPVRLDRRLRIRGDLLLTPTGRLLRLGPAGRLALVDAQRGRGSRAFARRLVDAGAGHPLPPEHPVADVLVVVPVRDRPDALDRCLASLGEVRVLVVDDGSHRPETVREVCLQHGATYVHRSNGGPAAARNTALEHAAAEVIAFVDSDVVLPAGALAALRGHLADPEVVAVAPRVVGGPRSPLDLGPWPASVRAGTAVAYVPTACLMVRRATLTAFDEALRYGEDVDLVWRLVDAGGTVRYDPSVVAEHTEPVRRRDRLVRRYRYGTSAAPLSQRHPGRLAHLVLPPWPTAVLALLLARRPLVAAAVAATMTVRLDRQVHDRSASARLVLGSVVSTGLGVGRVLALLGPLGWWVARDRRGAALLLAPYLLEWGQRRPDLDPVRYVATALLDQAAYGAGVVSGCASARTIDPLRPQTGIRRA